VFVIKHLSPDFLQIYIKICRGIIFNRVNNLHYINTKYLPTANEMCVYRLFRVIAN
jgi:hypothetical protein